ncbi:MAG: hemolysin family protein [Treponema sp.]|jgi:putative hemolysin|nr:hemolysin family protein [Treponema sp.]
MDPLPSNYFIIISIIISLIIITAIFSLFDSALELCRKSRLEKERAKRYKAVLEILENPHHIFLACRLWNNILKIFTAVFAGYSSIIIINRSIHIVAFLAIYAFVLGIIITLLCSVLPRLLAHKKPEKIAAFLLPVMKLLSIPMLPLTLLVLKFTEFLNKSIRPEINNDSITEEELQDELRNTLLEGEKSGVVETGERAMVEGVFYLGDRPVGAFMTHRSEIQWLDINTPYEEVREQALEHRGQRCFPVTNASPDQIVGTVFLEDIILDYAQSEPQGLRAIMRKAQFVPETMPALKAFESFKHGQSNFLFVMDEYGGLAGIISITALVEEIVGELSMSKASEEPLLCQEDGSYLADGTLNIDDAAKALSLTGLGEEGDFHTLAGLILHLSGELPRVGDSFEYQGYRFKVVDKDGNRIDKLLITKIKEE